jgi:catalase (peroxidase I)
VAVAQVEGPGPVRGQEDKVAHDAAVSRAPRLCGFGRRWADQVVCSTDMALIKDKSFRKYAEIYAKDEDAFFKE